ncbi:MAG: hypothetical protein ACI4RO_00390, partial [Candidatus Scatosoma sp.]
YEETDEMKKYIAELVPTYRYSGEDAFEGTGDSIAVQSLCATSAEGKPLPRRERNADENRTAARANG